MAHDAFRAVSFLPALRWTRLILVHYILQADAQTPSQTPLDFSVAGQDTDTTVQEVVSGIFLIYAEVTDKLMRSGKLDIVVQQTLGMVCKNFDFSFGAPAITKFYQDIRTLGKTRIGLNYSWWVLPPVQAGKDCVDKISMASYGPSEPPFTTLPAPAIRTLFSFQKNLIPETKFIDISNWAMSVQNLSCDKKNVISWSNHSKSIDVFPTLKPQCIGPALDAWKPSTDGKFDSAAVGGCDIAAGNACLCAAIKGCEWQTSIRRCAFTANPGVPCSACPQQSSCIPTPQSVCAAFNSPDRKSVV